MDIKAYKTLKVRFQDPVCTIQFYRPEANNTINQLFVQELSSVIAMCEIKASVVVLEGLPEVFCFGADFQGMQQIAAGGEVVDTGPEPLYELWLRMATGPFITISHVRGKANAGGMGFVAASDIVLADETALFSLSELLFGLMPACVLPFLIRRIGFQKAHYMTLMTQPIQVQQALQWGLVDAYEPASDALVRRHLLRLRRLPKEGIARYKRYMNALDSSIVTSKGLALDANKEVFGDRRNLEGIFRFVQTGQFPWENN